MPCKQKCSKWKAKRPPNGKRYESGQVRCDTCQTFMYPSLEHTHNTKTKEPDENQKNGLSCNCCNMRVSGRSYSAKYSRYQNPNSPKTFEELEKYFEEDIQPQANYQYVIVKTILENKGNCNEEKIREEIKFYNKTQQNIDYEIGISTLVNHGLIRIEGDTIELNIDDSSVTSEKSLRLISLCNRYIYQNLDPKSIQHFTAVGGYENWRHVISNPPVQWAITTTNPSNVAVWELANENDLVYYYPTKDDSPYSKRGFFGIGVIKRKLIDDILYWPDEISEIKSKYPNKLILDTLHVLFDENE